MEELFAERIVNVPRSFIREILKVSLDPEIISFAGSLPNREFFPVTEIQVASNRVFDRCGRDMLQYSIDRHLPADISWTRPEGGMFLWGRLPGDLNAMKLFDLAVREKVVFVPGDPFYTTRTGVATMRLNFSCTDAETIERGIIRLRRALKT